MSDFVFEFDIEKFEEVLFRQDKFKTSTTWGKKSDICKLSNNYYHDRLSIYEPSTWGYSGASGKIIGLDIATSRYGDNGIQEKNDVLDSIAKFPFEIKSITIDLANLYYSPNKNSYSSYNSSYYSFHPITIIYKDKEYTIYDSSNSLSNLDWVVENYNVFIVTKNYKFQVLLSNPNHCFSDLNLGKYPVILPKNFEVFNVLVNQCKLSYKEIKIDGCAKALAKNSDKLKELYNKYYASWLLFTSLTKSAKTIDGISMSTLINAILNNYDVEGLSNIFNKVIDGYSFDNKFYIDFFKDTPEYKTMFKNNIDTKQKGAIKKILTELEYLPSMEGFPILQKAIELGDIPTGIFFRKSQTDTAYFSFNTNYSLWEKMLELDYAVTIDVAKNASTRTTYERDVMSYFYFLLYGLPEYMKELTGDTWTCKPKVIHSSSELVPVKNETKKKSALTPQVDNINKTIVVPYACLAIPGAQTTYTYSLNYELIHKGLNLSGDVVTKTIEEKLNGRDDYGLMYYTFTGSPQGRGNPTFLIIKENRKNSYWIHFHRVHPTRSKDNEDNPISNWTKTCYGWMCGNIHKEDIINQQGDLVFIKTDKVLDNGNIVNAYDDHEFANSVTAFTPSKTELSDNIIIYVQLDNDTELKHSEHENIILPAGKYQVRQVRSWEANPKGVWSLRID